MTCYTCNLKVRKIESGEEELPTLELREDLKNLDNEMIVQMTTSDRLRRRALLLHDQGERLPAENMWRVGQIWIHT